MDLVDVRGKLDRAEQHLQTFRAEVRTFLRMYEEAVRPRPPTDSDQEWELVGAPPIPTHWPALVGDIAHNVRSALDHLAWQLVIESGGVPTRQPPATSFPIHEAAPGHPPTVRPVLRADFQALLEEAQPYRQFAIAGLNPRKSPLFLIKELNNLDKHVIILPVVGVLQGVSWSLPPAVQVVFVRNPSPLRDGDTVGRFVFTSSGPIDLHPSFTFVVRADIPGFPEVATGDLCDWALSGAMSFVCSLVQRFENAAYSP